MKYIYINKSRTNENNKPLVCLEIDNKIEYYNEILIKGFSKIKCSPEKPLISGATCYIQVEDNIELEFK